MSETNPEPTHQDPAEPNQVDTEVETDSQPEPVVPVEPSDGNS